MKTIFCVSLVALTVTSFAATGKGSWDEQSSSPRRSLRALTVSQKAEPAGIAASLAKLSAEDRRLIEAQKLCPIMTSKRLGAMGTPIKLMIKGQPVFVCCKGCHKRALADPDKTLATVAKLKSKVTGSGRKE